MADLALARSEYTDLGITDSEHYRNVSERIPRTTSTGDLAAGTKATRKNAQVAEPAAMTSAFSSVSGNDPERIRECNRALTRLTLVPQLDHFTNERNALVRKKFCAGLTPKEERRLAFVSWQLDRIDDAERGHQIDQLEKLIEAHERLGSTIKDSLKAIESHRRTQPKQNRR